MKPRTITIIVTDGNNFAVHEGERYANRLCWDEMLGQVACMTHPKINDPRYAMHTPEELAAWRERMLARRAKPEDSNEVEQGAKP